MKILFVTMDSLEVNSSANLRNRGVIYGLLAMGHAVDTCSLEKCRESIHYDESMTEMDRLANCRYFISPDPWYTKLRTKKTEVSDCHIKKTWMDSLKIQGMKKAKHFADCISIYDKQKINVKQIRDLEIDTNSYDAILSSSDPKSAHLFGYELWKRADGRVPWIQYWGDPMYDDITRKSGYLKGWRLKKEEKRLLEKASVIVYTSPFTLEKQQHLYAGMGHKMCYTVQSCITDTSRPAHNKKQINQEQMTLGYFGDYHSAVRNVWNLFQAAVSLNMPLLVCGNGDVKMDSPLIRYFPRLNKENLMKKEDEADIIICVCNRKGTQIPGKIYYESSSQKPIILIVDGEYKEQMKHFFAGFHRYIICENQPQTIQNAIISAKEEIIRGKTYHVPIQMQPAAVAGVILKKLEEMDHD